MGGFFLDLRPITGPSTSFKYRSVQSQNAIIRVLLAALCRPANMESPGGTKCHDYHPVPRPPPPPVPVQQLAELERRTGGESEEILESDPENEDGTVSADSTESTSGNSSDIFLSPVLPYGRKVFFSIEEILWYKKGSKKKDLGVKKKKKGRRRGKQGEDKDGKALEEVRMVRFEKSEDFPKGLQVNFERSVFLDFELVRYMWSRCMLYRKHCSNGGVYRPTCPFTKPYQISVASGTIERCDRWCPSETDCYSNNERPGKGLVKVLLKSTARLARAALVARFSGAFVSPAGDVYGTTYMLDPRGYCFGYSTSKGGIRVDGQRALGNGTNDGGTHGTVFVATSYRSSVYSFVVEGLTRMMPYYGTLCTSKDIKVHVRSLRGTDGTGGRQLPHFVPEMMEILGILRERIVSGDVWARHVITSEAICKAPSGAREAALLQKLQVAIHKGLEKKGLKRTPVGKDRYILLVVNTWHRKIINWEPLAEQIRTVTKLQVKVHHDNGFHNVSFLWPLFYGASLIIGAHGGALTHLVACQPGTPVLEFVQPVKDLEDPAGGNIDFQILATSLGLPHHSMAPTFVNPRFLGAQGDPYFVINDTYRMARKVMHLIDTKEGKRDWRVGAQIQNFSIPRT